MKGKYLVLRFITILKRCTPIRILAAPFIIVHRKIIKLYFKTTDDYKYIRGLKDTHTGQRCVIIGNGPSLKVEDLEAIQNEFSFASNRIYTLFSKTKWRPSAYMCGDMSLLKECGNSITGMDEDTICLIRLNAKKYISSNMKTHYFVHDGKYSINKERLMQEKVSNDPADHFSITQSVTCLLFELAFYMGFNEIYLLGLDHRFPVEIDMQGHSTQRKVAHHFKEEKLSQMMHQNYCYKEALTKCYEIIRNYADANGIRIYDVTRNGELKVFEKKPFEEISWK